MNDRTGQTVGAVALILGLVALMLILALTALHAVGTDAALYYSEQTKAGILPRAGLSDGELRELDHRLAAYLRGDAAALEADPPFGAREMAHMRDCHDLFALLRKVRRRLIPWAVLLIVGGAYLLRAGKRASLSLKGCRAAADSISPRDSDRIVRTEGDLGSQGQVSSVSVSVSGAEACSNKAEAHWRASGTASGYRASSRPSSPTRASW